MKTIQTAPMPSRDLPTRGNSSVVLTAIDLAFWDWVALFVKIGAASLVASALIGAVLFVLAMLVMIVRDGMLP